MSNLFKCMGARSAAAVASIAILGAQAAAQTPGMIMSLTTPTVSKVERVGGKFVNKESMSLADLCKGKKVTFLILTTDQCPAVLDSSGVLNKAAIATKNSNVQWCYAVDRNAPKLGERLLDNVHIYDEKKKEEVPLDITKNTVLLDAGKPVWDYVGGKMTNEIFALGPDGKKLASYNGITENNMRKMFDLAKIPSNATSEFIKNIKDEGIPQSRPWPGCDPYWANSRPASLASYWALPAGVGQGVTAAQQLAYARAMQGMTPLG